MSEQKNLPTHRISFSERQEVDGQEKLGRPIEVATVWPRNGDKQGGILQWHVEPSKLGEGAWFMLDAQRERSQEQGVKGALDQIDQGVQQERSNGLDRS